VKMMGLYFFIVALSQMLHTRATGIPLQSNSQLEGCPEPQGHGRTS